MSAGVHVQADARELTQHFAKAAARSLAPTMQVVAEHLAAAVSDQFETGGDGRWAPLAASTLAGRRKAGAGAQILVDSGIFAGSIEAGSGEDFAEASTSVAYSVFHVSDAPRTKIPLRNPFDIAEQRLTEAELMIVQGIAESLSRGT